MRGTSHKIGLGLKCPVKTWDKELRRAKGKNKEAQAINAHLDLIRSRFNTLHLKCEHDKIALTCEQVKNYILYEKSIEPEAPVLPTFLEVWKEYIAYRKELQVIRGLPDSKERVWGVKCKMIERACNTLSLRVSVAQISLKHAYQLYDFFVLQEKKVERSVARLIRDCRTVFAFAQRREYIKSNPFADFSVQLPTEPAPLFLTEEDLKSINTAIVSEKGQKAKEAFLFLCYTGLLYADFADLSELNVSTYNGRQWIEGQRKKGESKRYGAFKLPLHKIAASLIEKWGVIEAFPKIARSNVNENLLEVEQASEVSLHLTTKLGRSTFAHQALNTWGVNIETVAKMMGHYSTQTTQRFYVKVNTEKIDRDTAGKM